MAKDKNPKTHRYPTRRKRETVAEYGNQGPPSDLDQEEEEEEEDDPEFDLQNYRKLLAHIFPSKYTERRASGTQDVESRKKNRSRKKQTSPPRRRRPRRESPPTSETESPSDSDLETDDEDYDTEELEKEMGQLLGGQGRNSKFNIIFTMAQPLLDEEYDEEYTEDEYSSEEDDEEEYSSDDQAEESGSDHRPDKSELKCQRSDSPERCESPSSTSDGVVLEKLRAAFEGLSEAERKTKAGTHLLQEVESQEKAYAKDLHKRSRRIRRKNTTKFRGLLKEKNVMNDLRFFREKLNADEQAVVLRQVEEIKAHCEVDKPYRLALLDAQIPLSYKACAYKKINTLRYMEPGSGEYYKIKQWVDAFMQIPFGVYKNLALTIEDGVEECHEFMSQAKQTLDKAVFGLDDAKLQIMQMVGQWIANPDALGNALAIQGPMGTGKTTLVKEGISKILGRDFAFFALGGATDSSVLEGHSYTYEGSTWGKIIDIVLQCKNMNPVIYFDELDKVSETPKGEEIIGILTHLTDTSQNNRFHDKYFAEIDFDLSRCLFIFSYNDESKVNAILKDRMYRIQTKGYSEKEEDDDCARVPSSENTTPGLLRGAGYHYSRRHDSSRSDAVHRRGGRCTKSEAVSGDHLHETESVSSHETWLKFVRERPPLVRRVSIDCYSRNSRPAH